MAHPPSTWELSAIKVGKRYRRDLGRRFIGTELKADYISLTHERLAADVCENV